MLDQLIAIPGYDSLSFTDSSVLAEHFIAWVMMFIGVLGPSEHSRFALSRSRR